MEKSSTCWTFSAGMNSCQLCTPPYVDAGGTRLAFALSCELLCHSLICPLTKCYWLKQDFLKSWQPNTLKHRCAGLRGQPLVLPCCFDTSWWPWGMGRWQGSPSYQLFSWIHPSAQTLYQAVRKKLNVSILLHEEVCTFSPNRPARACYCMIKIYNISFSKKKDHSIPSTERSTCMSHNSPTSYLPHHTYLPLPQNVDTPQEYGIYWGGVFKFFK